MTDPYCSNKFIKLKSGQNFISFCHNFTDIVRNIITALVTDFPVKIVNDSYLSTATVKGRIYNNIFKKS